MTGLGPLKRINVLDKVIVGFGGREGVDSKVMLFLPGTGSHYTMKMLTSFTNLPSSIPIDIHKTWEGPQKRYQPIARGQFNLQPIIETIASALKPSVERVDLSSSEWRSREVLPLDSILNSVFGKRELKITETWANQFTTGAVSDISQSSTIMAVTGSQDRGGFLITAGGEGMYFKMPAMEALERKLQESLELTPLVDLEDEFDGLLGDKEY